MKAGNDKRRFQRVPKEFDVRITKSFESKGPLEVESYIGKSLNVSACGILVTLDNSVTVGEHVKITFLKPNTFELFNGEGTIIRSRSGASNDAEIAIDFIGLSALDHNSMNYYITLNN